MGEVLEINTSSNEKIDEIKEKIEFKKGMPCDE